MDIRPIHTDADYKAALKDIASLMESDPDQGTPDGDRLDILATLVQAYEARHFPMDAPDPVDAIKFRMEQGGFSVKDLEPIIGKIDQVIEQLAKRDGFTFVFEKRDSGLVYAQTQYDLTNEVIRGYNALPKSASPAPKQDTPVAKDAPKK